MVSNDTPQAADYYAMGNSELAIESRLTVDRLEPRRRLTKTSTRTVIVLVGLPARGKSFVARKLYAYLNWYSTCQCKIFNVGKYRRQAYAAATTVTAAPTERQSLGSCDAQFFDASNTAGQALRQQVAADALRDMLDWLGGGEMAGSGDSSDGSSSSCEDVLGKMHSFRGRSSERVAIFDATNSTQARREWILNMCRTESMRKSSLFEKSIEVVFVESICDDLELLDENYRYKVSSSPDFRGIPVAEALSDLKSRVAKYEAQYETLADDTMSYIKIFNLSTKLMVNHIYGRMAKDLVPALMAWHIGTRPIYLCRPGQTISGIHTDGEDYVNPQKMIHLPSHGGRGSSLRSLRGDTLGPNGQSFKAELWEFLEQDVAAFVKRRASVRDYNDDYDYYESSLRIYTSIMPRAADTVSFPVTDTDYSVEQLSNLNPLDKGDLVGLGMDEIQEKDPNWYQKLEGDPYHTRFPGGESYSDIMSRLHSVIIDVEQEVVPTLVVSHVSILQCLMAYFRCSDVEKCMSIEVPLHTVIKFTPVRGGGWSESHHPFYEIPDEVLTNNSSTHNVPPTDENTAAEAAAVCQKSALDQSDHSVCSKPPPPIWGDGMPTPQTRLLQKRRGS